MLEGSEFIRHELRELCREIDAKDITYCTDVLDHSCYFPSQVKFYGRWQRRNQVFFSSDHSKKTFQRWAGKHLNSDRNFSRCLQQSKYDWRYSNERSSGSKALLLLNDSGYSKVTTIAIPCPLSEHYVARFALMDAAKSDEEGFSEMLQQFHIKMTLGLGTQINPLLDLKLVSPTAIKVLKLLAQGCSRSEVAKGCSISERGVDYHLNSLKNLLNANTLSEMIYQACRKRLI